MYNCIYIYIYINISTWKYQLSKNERILRYMDHSYVSVYLIYNKETRGINSNYPCIRAGIQIVCE